MPYPAAARHLARMFATATDEQLLTPIRWTPGWNARDVLAHLVNNAQLAVAGINRAPSDEQAQEAVRSARELPVVVLTSSLEQLADQVQTAPTGPTVEWDLVCHLADVAEAWTLPQPPDELWRPVLHKALDHCAQTGRLPCRVTVAGQTWGDGPEVVVHDAYQLFRALFARRPLSTLDAEGDATLLAAAVLFA